MKATKKEKGNATEAMDWNQMLGFTSQLRSDGLINDYILIFTNSYWGLRISDFLKITWRQVLDCTEFTIHEQKTGKLRRITLNDKVIEALNYSKAQLESKGKFHIDNYLINTKYGAAPSVSYLNKRLKLLFNRYGINVRKASTHVLRKSFGAQLFLKNGKSDASLIMLSDLFNHSTTAITRRYIGLRDSAMQELYRSL